MVQPLVSIIVPVYNVSSFLAECLDSLIHQTYKNLEIICINDGSTDNSLKVLEKYKKEDSRIKIITQKNGGLSNVRNRGIQLASGKYISFVDSDDFIDLNTIYESVELLGQKNVDAVLYNMEMFFPNNSSYICFSGELYPQHNGIMDTTKNELCINFSNVTPAVFVKNSIKSFFIEKMLYEDWAFMAQYFTQKIKVYWLNKPFYKYRRDFDNSITAIISPKCLDLFKTYYIASDTIKKRHFEWLYGYINDIKILNEATGFIQARFLSKHYNCVVYQFISELYSIISKFPETYYQFLLSFFTPDRRYMLDKIKNNFSDRATEVDCEKIFKKIKIRFYIRLKLSLLKQRTKNLFSNIFRLIKLPLKKVAKMVLPSYRVSSATRQNLDVLMADNRYNFSAIKSCLQKYSFHKELDENDSNEKNENNLEEDTHIYRDEELLKEIEIKMSELDHLFAKFRSNQSRALPHDIRDER